MVLMTSGRFDNKFTLPVYEKVYLFSTSLTSLFYIVCYLNFPEEVRFFFSYDGPLCVF